LREKRFLTGLTGLFRIRFGCGFLMGYVFSLDGGNGPKTRGRQLKGGTKLAKSLKAEIDEELIEAVNA